MWWEILPSAAIIGTVFWVIPTLSEHIGKALYNTVSKQVPCELGFVDVQ